MAGRRSRHECRPVGELALKGLPDPVATVEVAWEPLGGADAGASIPIPARLAVRPAVGVVGRDGETASMWDAFKRVAAGEPKRDSNLYRHLDKGASTRGIKLCRCWSALRFSRYGLLPAQSRATKSRSRESVHLVRPVRLRQLN
jgi:hypothetical protein